MAWRRYLRLRVVLVFTLSVRPMYTFVEIT
jgi:hypothetical protein